MNVARAKILIVDDDRDATESMAAFLETEGYRTVIAHGGQEAVERFREDGFGAVILDLKMPGMGGKEALTLMRQIDRKANVLMITGDVLSESATDLYSAGTSHVLYKPVDPEELLSTLEA